MSLLEKLLSLLDDMSNDSALDNQVFDWNPDRLEYYKRMTKRLLSSALVESEDGSNFIQRIKLTRCLSGMTHNQLRTWLGRELQNKILVDKKVFAGLTEKPSSDNASEGEGLQ